MPPFESIVYILCLSVFIAELYLSRYEIISDFYIKGIQIRGDWGIQHDERMCLSDARCWYLKTKGKNVSHRDYLPYQISAAFGLFIPTIIYIGFRWFGLNNFGLRFMTIVLMSLSNFFVISMILKLASPIIAFAGCLVYLLNWNNFILNRHPTPETLFTFFINSFFYVLVCHHEFYLQNWAIISFLAGSTILLKVNFPIQFLSLFLTVNLVVFDIKTLFTSALLYGCGILFFETLQFLILKRMGIVKDRYFNLFMVSKVHTGQKVVWDNPGIYLKYKILIVFANLFMEWFGAKTVHYDLDKKKSLLFTFMILLFISGQVAILNIDQHFFKFLPVGIILFSLIVSPFHFAFKRFISVFPLTFLLIITTVDIVNRVIKPYELFFIILLVALAFIVIINQIRSAVRFIRHRSLGLKKIVSDIESKLPEGAPIYCHLFAYRAIWQIQKQRVYTCDDNVMRNQNIIDWAIKKGGRFVLLSEKGWVIEMETWKLLMPIAFFYVTPVETDTNDIFGLYEIDL